MVLFVGGRYFASHVWIYMLIYWASEVRDRTKRKKMKQNRVEGNVSGRINTIERSVRMHIGPRGRLGCKILNELLGIRH